MIDQPNDPTNIEHDEDKPKWALEVTQNKILKELTNMAKDTKKGASTLEKISSSMTELSEKDNELLNSINENSAATTEFLTGKFLSEMNRSGNKLKNTLGGLDFGDDDDDGYDLSKTDAINDLMGNTHVLSQSFANFANSMNGNMMPMTSIQGASKKAGAGLQGLATKFPKLGGIMMVFGATIGAVGAIIGNQYDTWQKLTQVGQNFSNDMFQMSAAVHGAGLTLDEGAKYITAHSALAANIGVTSMLKLQKETRKLTSQFGNYGMEVAQIAEITASYTESQVALGLFSKLDDKAKAKQTKDYIRNLSVLSKLTGKQAEEMDKERKSFMEGADMVGAAAAIAMRHGQEASDNFMRTMNENSVVFAAMPGETGKMIEEQITNLGKYGTEAVGEYGRLGGQLGHQFEGIMGNMYDASLAGNSDEVKKAAFEYSLAIKNLTKEQRTSLMLQQDANPAAKAMLATYYKQNEVFGDTSTYEQMEAKLDKLGKSTDINNTSTAAMAKIGDKWRDMMGRLAEKMQGPLSQMFDMFIMGFEQIESSGIFDQLLGIGMQLFDTLGPVLSAVTAVLIPTLQVLAPLFEAFIVVLKPVLKLVSVLAGAIETLIHGFVDGWNMIVKWLSGFPVIGKMFEGMSKGLDAINGAIDNTVKVFDRHNDLKRDQAGGGKQKFAEANMARTGMTTAELMKTLTDEEKKKIGEIGSTKGVAAARKYMTSVTQEQTLDVGVDGGNESDKIRENIIQAEKERIAQNEANKAANRKAAQDKLKRDAQTAVDKSTSASAASDRNPSDVQLAEIARLLEQQVAMTSYIVDSNERTAKTAARNESSLLTGPDKV